MILFFMVTFPFYFIPYEKLIEFALIPSNSL